MTCSSTPSLLLGLTLALTAPIFLSSCDTKAKEAALLAGEEVASLQKANSRLENDVKLLREQSETRHNELLKQNEELQKEADAAKSQFEKLQDDAAKAQKELDEYMAKYKLGYRAKLKGQSLATLKTTESVAYQTVVLREITPTEVSFTHSNGVIRVAMDKLPPDLQRKFLYDPDEVKRQEEAQVAAATATEGLEGLDGQVVQRDPSRSVNPIVVKNLRTRIQTRQKDIQKATVEAQRVKQSGFTSTNLGQLRIRVLDQRRTRLQDEIQALVAMLDKELNG